MTQLEQTKLNAVKALKQLCLRCQSEAEHVCPITELIERIEKLSGIPVIVNEELKHVVFQS